MTQQKRPNIYQIAPTAGMALLGPSNIVHDSTALDKTLLALVNIRASQINGCAFCTIMHVTEARDAGETENRLHSLAVWREAGAFSDREQTALAWTEALTDLAHRRVSDELYERAHAEFGDAGLADLTLAISVINAWNRLNVAFATPPDWNYRTKRAIQHA